MSSVKRLKYQESVVKPSSRFSHNLVKNLLTRDLGLLSTYEFMSEFNRTRLKDLALSRTRSIKQFSNSITWLSLDNIDSRYLLAARSDGSFMGIDMFQDRVNEPSTATELKLLFNQKQLRNTHTHAISCIQWYPIDTGMFFTSGMDQKFKVWDTNSLVVADEYLIKHKIYSHHISTQNSNLVALALDNGQVRFIDLNNGSAIHMIKAHSQGYCVSVQWSPSNSNILATAGSDGRIGLWDVRSSKSSLMYLDSERTSEKSSSSSSTWRSPTAHSGAIVSLAYTPDSNHIISLGKDNQLRLWDAANGRNTLVNYGRIALSSALNPTTETSIQLACSTDSDLVFVPSASNLLMLGMFDGESKRVLKGHFEPLTCCVYNSASNEVYTGSRDRNILIWDTVKNEDNEKRKNFGTSSVHAVLSSTGRAEDNWSDED